MQRFGVEIVERERAAEETTNTAGRQARRGRQLTLVSFIIYYEIEIIKTVIMRIELQLSCQAAWPPVQ